MTPAEPPRLPGIAPAPPPTEVMWEAWYEEYGTSLYSFIRFHVDSADVAEDLTAEAFLKAFRAADRFDPSKGNVRVWLFRIAQNALRDHLRKARLRRHVPLDAMRDLVSDAPSAEERLLWEEQVAGLLDGVAALKQPDREVLGLRYGSNLDHRAIGEILGIRESAVRTRLWRALGHLSTMLEHHP